MRLWASCDSITFDEYAPRLGEATEISLGLSIASVVPCGLGTRTRGWPYDLAPLGEAGLVQLPALERSFTAVTGILSLPQADPPSWRIDSAVPIVALGSWRPPVQSSLERVLGNAERAGCAALGTLTVCGKEMAGPIRPFFPAHILRFQSLCLRAGDSCFGTWSDVRTYGDLLSDADVIAAAVLLAEIELPLERMGHP